MSSCHLPISDFLVMCVLIALTTYSVPPPRFVIISVLLVHSNVNLCFVFICIVILYVYGVCCCHVIPPARDCIYSQGDEIRAPRSEFQWSVRIKMRKSSNLITRRIMQFLLHMWRVSVFSVPLDDITEGKMLLMASAAAAWLPLNHPPAITTALTACTLLAFRGRRWKGIKLFCERKKCPNWICSHHHFDYSQAFAFPCSYLEWGGGNGGTE